MGTNVMKSGAIVSPDVPGFDERALLDLLGDLTPLEGPISQTLVFVPSVVEPSGSRKYVAEYGDAQWRLVDFELDPADFAGMDSEDLRSEVFLGVETFAGWKLDPKRSVVNWVRGGKYLGSVHYRRMSGPTDVTGSAREGTGTSRFVEEGSVQDYRLTVFRCSSSSKGIVDIALDELRDPASGRFTPVRFGMTVLGDEALAEIRFNERLAQLREADVDLGSEGVLLLRIEELPGRRSVVTGYRPTDLTEGPKTIRLLRRFAQDAGEADVFDALGDEIEVAVEEPDLD